MKRFAALAMACLLSLGAAAATQYTYDELNRLTKVQYDDGRSIAYRYDAAGNLLAQARTGTPDLNNGWCGQTLRFDNNQLPANWTAKVYFGDRSPSGLRNGRIEVAPVPNQLQGGVVRIDAQAVALDSAVAKLVVEHDLMLLDAVGGQHTGLELRAADGVIWTFSFHGGVGNGTPAGQINFGVQRGRGLYGDGVAPFVIDGAGAAAPYTKGAHRVRLELVAGLVRWTLTNVSTAQVMVASYPLAAAFRPAAITEMHYYLDTTNGNTAWADNLAVQCLGTAAMDNTAMDAASQFSATTNPSGPWDYGWAGAADTGFNRFSSNAKPRPEWLDLNYWADGARPYPLVIFNPSQAANGTVEPRALYLHPGDGTDMGVLRWTAPAAGVYSVLARIKGIVLDLTTTDVHIRRNGLPLFDSAVTSAQQPGGLPVFWGALLALAAGDWRHAGGVGGQRWQWQGL